MRNEIFTVIFLIQDVLLFLLYKKSLSLRKSRQSYDENEKIVSLNSNFYSSICIIMGLLSFFVIIMPLIDDELGSGYYATFGLFEATVVVLLFLGLDYINHAVKYSETGFETINIFGKKKEYRYDDITGITRMGNAIILYCGKSKIKIELYFYSGGDEFVAYVEQKYLSCKNKQIPEVKRKDPMNGNLSDPWLAFILNCLFFAAGIIMIGLAVYFLIAQTLRSSACVLLIIGGLFLAGFSVLGTLVGRHPERYPTRLCRLVASGFLWKPGVLKDKKEKKD